jgi:dTDP-4-dehydrorhamnose reductase
VRVLITGASGLLGGRLCALLGERFKTVAALHTAEPPEGCERVPLDLGSPASLAAALDQARPDAVVHAAACADVDVCEREPERARLLNALATERLSALCLERRTRLVALSTDLVLAGDRPLADERVEPLPTLEYGRSKHAAERAVLSASPDFTVLRVALVIGHGFGPRSTASEGVLWALASGGRPLLFTDQYRTPVDAESIADAIARVLSGRGSGLFHLGGLERVSRYELGRRVALAFGFDAARLEPVEQALRPIGLPRPADCSLDITRARRELGWEPRPLELGIRGSRLSAGPA